MLIQQTRMLQTASHPQQKHQNHYLLRNSQPSGCKEEGVRDPLPCTAPIANLLASCLILTEWGWGREIPHINSHNQSYKGEKKKNPQSSPRFTSPPELQHRKNKDTHTYTQGVKGNVIPLAALFLYHVPWQQPGLRLYKEEAHRRCGCEQQSNSPGLVMSML